jgi:uncharacterized membrane protein
MPVWAEQFYFVFQAVETAFMIFLSPYVIYLLYRGFLGNERIKSAGGLILLVLMMSVYQAIVPLFCGGVFACFVLLQENSDYEPKVYRILCLKLFITLLAASVVYFLLDKIFVEFIFKTEKSEYLDNMALWGKISLRSGIRNILAYGYTITIGCIRPVTEWVLAQFAHGPMYKEYVLNHSRIMGNIFLLPAVICFIIQIGKNIQKKKFRGRCLLYVLAGIGIPLSIMMLSMISGNIPSARTMYALPFASAFIFFYLIEKYKKQSALIISGIVLIVSIHQAEITAQLFYSDYLRYQADVRLTVELDRRITRIQDEAEQLPVALIGKYEPAFKSDFLPGEVIGHSCFSWMAPSDFFESTSYGLPFMQSLGINYKGPDQSQMHQARERAKFMPPYPAEGSVERLQNVIVVKLSDSTYRGALTAP